MAARKKPWLSHDPRSLVLGEELQRQNGQVKHAFFTRQGGVSQAPVAGLNCGYGATSDDPKRIKQNRAFVAGTLGVKACNLVTPYQVHGTEVVEVVAPWAREEAPKADALVSRVPGVAIGVLTADCVPLLLADFEQGVVGAAHAGWRGALAGVLKATVARMVKLGAQQHQIHLALGPAIGQSNYEVDGTYRAHFLDHSETTCEDLFISGAAPDKFLFDLKGFIVRQAEGLSLGAVGDVARCTYQEPENFFSYRRSVHQAEPDYGRQISAIVLGNKKDE